MVSSTPRPHFIPGKDPVPILQGAGWASGPVWTSGKSSPHRDSIPDRPARSQSLYRLSYPAHIHIYSIYIYIYICIYIVLQYCHKNRDTLRSGIHANSIFQIFLRVLKLILPQRVTAIAPLKLQFPERPQVLLTMGVELNTVSCTESHLFSLESISTNSRGSRHSVLTFRRQEVARQT